jgi:uncharacterized membrane protein YgaE (UPF0421/DUF939 family)
MNEYLPYAAVIIAVVGFCVQFGMFVRPVELEKKHREILEDAEKKFATLQQIQDLKEDFKDIKEKINKIYDCLIENKACR